MNEPLIRMEAICSFKTGMSLAKAYLDWTKHDHLYIKAKRARNVANQSYIGITKSLFKFLEGAGFEPIAYEAQGIRFKLQDPAPELELILQTKGPIYLQNNLKHGLVTVNQLVIDPIGRERFGDRYPDKDNYPMREATELWTALDRVDNLINLKPSDVDILTGQKSVPVKRVVQEQPPLPDGHLDFYRDIAPDAHQSLNSSSVLRRARVRQDRTEL